MSSLGALRRLRSSLSLRDVSTRAQTGGGGIVIPSTKFSWLSPSSPGGFVHSGQAGRGYRDSGRKRRWSQLNMPRFHHMEDGTPLGTIFERAHEFECRLKTNPTSNSGAFSGGQDANITYASDPPILAGLNEIGGEYAYTSYWKFDNSAGGSTFSKQILATTGNTLIHSNRYTAMSDAPGGTAGCFTSGGTLASSPISQANTWEEITLNGFTPTSSARLITVSVPAGKILYLAQVDQVESIDAPQPILKDIEPGAAFNATPDSATRTLTDIVGWNTGETTLAVQFYQAIRFVSSSEPILSLTSSGDPTTYVEIRGGANNTLEAEQVIAGVSSFSSVGLAALPNEVNRAVIRLKPGEFGFAANGNLGSPVGAGGVLSALDTITINKRGTNYGCSIMQELELASIHLGDNYLAAASLADELGII